jgi:arylsulfatase A-like enzyme
MKWNPMTAYLLLGQVCFSVPQAALHGAGSPAKPNVLFILADDLGWSDTTLYGTTKFYQTPNIERLAKRGMTFTRAYSASPLCSPTRAAILTGMSPARTGITAPNCHLPEVVMKASAQAKAAPENKTTVCRSVTRLDTNYFTLAKTLKQAGYATGHFGKWHLGPEPYSPLQHGFDVDVPHHPGPGPAGSFVAPWKFKDFKHNTPGEHIEDRMAKEAVAWMEKNKDRPFYLNYWMFSVHAPFDAKKALIEKHRARVNPSDPQRSPTYAAMVESMDDAVGTLLDALDRLGLAHKTIVVFTSDNGGNMYSDVDRTVPTSNHPLRGGKATMFEGGTRVPCVVAWPGVTRAGSRSDAMIQSEDYYPTFFAGLGLAQAAGQRFDGTSFLSALKGEPFERGAIFQYFPHNPTVPDWLPPSVSAHRGDWKLIRVFHGGTNGNHRHLLFNLRDDLGEKSNLAAQQPERVRELDALIERFLADTRAVLPLPNPAFDPAKYRPEDEGKSQPKSKIRRSATPKKPGAARKPVTPQSKLTEQTK